MCNCPIGVSDKCSVAEGLFADWTIAVQRTRKRRRGGGGKRERESVCCLDNSGGGVGGGGVALTWLH